MTKLAWITRTIRSGWTRARRYARSSIEKPPIKYFILTYRICASRDPFEGWDSARVKYRQYSLWAFAFSVGATALDPSASVKPNWLDGLPALTSVQLAQFEGAFGMPDGLLSFKEVYEESTLPGSTHLSDNIREKAGSVDPFDVANFLSTKDADLGRSYLKAIKREERASGIAEKIAGFSLPLFLFAGVFPIHWMLAQKGTPLRTTERPYLLVSGSAALLTAAFTVFVLAPFHYFARESVSFNIEGSGQKLIGAAAICLAVIYISKQSAYLNAVYDRSPRRLFWSILIATCCTLIFGYGFAIGVSMAIHSVL